MKKFLKVVFTLSIIAAAIAGALYFIKNILMKDYLDDYDDDFDNDLFDDEDDEDRDYVTLHKEDETEASDESPAETEKKSDAGDSWWPYDMSGGSNKSKKSDAKEGASGSNDDYWPYDMSGSNSKKGEAEEKADKAENKAADAGSQDTSDKKDEGDKEAGKKAGKKASDTSETSKDGEKISLKKAMGDMGKGVTGVGKGIQSGLEKGVKAGAGLVDKDDSDGGFLKWLRRKARK